MTDNASFTRALVTRNRAPMKFVGVTAKYKNGFMPLRDVTCQFEHATSSALVGANGSGKTTMLQLIAGLLRPSAGSIDPSPSQKSVAYVPQQLGLNAWLPLTVSDVLRMSRFRDRGLLRHFGPADRIIIEDAAERLDVLDLQKRQFGELSGGQRQRVMVAQALAHDSDVLLMDEPITGLDVPSQETIVRIIDEERRRGRIVVISTHHMDEADLCDQVLLLAGRLIAAGPPSEVLTKRNLQEAFGLLIIPGDEEDCDLHGDDDSGKRGILHMFHDYGHGHGHDHDNC